MSSLFEVLGATKDSHAVLAILIDSALKGAMVLTLAALFAAGCRRTSASVRHLIWALALVGAGALPLLSLVVPHARLTILPSAIGSAAGANSASAAASRDSFRAQLDPQQFLLAREGQPVAPALDRAPAATQGTRANDAWSSRLLFVWAAGATIVLARLLVGLVAVWLKGHRAAPITDGECTRLLDELALRYDVTRPVSLRVGAGNTMPATWGLARPLVLLPVEALDWPQDRLRAVLAHELAHIARGDFLVQTLARAACALHWFNPLAWFAGGRLRAECEQASDDLVLSAGLTPSDYAAHLVAVLMAARPDRKAAGIALAMARPNGFETRLCAILDGARSRARVSWRRIALTSLAATGLLGCLSMIQLEARAHDAPKLDSLPQGMTVEVVGVSAHPSVAATWWGPAGAPLAQAPCDPAAPVAGAADHDMREIVVRITGLPRDAELSWHPTQSRSYGTPAPRKDGVPVPGLQATVAEFARGSATCVLHFDIALGDWTTERSQRGGKSIGIQKDGRAFFFGAARPTPKGTAITIAHDIHARSVRVVAIDQDGHEHIPLSLSSGGAGAFMGLDAEFDLPPDQIREYRVQSRPVGRFAIKNVALQPRKGAA